MKRYGGWITVLLGLLPAAAICGADWPQYRYDAGRTAASPEELPPTLHLQWTRRFPAPRPVFPGEVRLRFDASYEPVVLGKTLFVPSMVTDSVTALDTDTGDERWQFFAEGPVRLAPVAWQGKVYFVSDDGHLYCVDAASGQLLWKFQGLPPGGQRPKTPGQSAADLLVARLGRTGAARRRAVLRLWNLVSLRRLRPCPRSRSPAR